MPSLPFAPRFPLLLLPLLALAAGCPWRAVEPPPEKPAASAEEQLAATRFLVIDDPALAAALAREWSSRAAAPVELVEWSAAELLAGEERPAEDVIVYPAGLLGELAERGWITPLPADLLDDPEYGARDIFELLRRHELEWGDRPHALPLGSPHLLLCYRADLLEQLQAEPPATWAEYQELAARLAAAGPEGATPWQGVCEPAAAGWAGQMLLARAAPYVKNRKQYSTLFDYRSMEPLIAGPPFVRALEEWVAAAEFASPADLDRGPAEAWRALLAGETAIAVTWPQSAAGETAGNGAGPIRLARLPGSAETYNHGDRAWERREEGESPRVPLLAVEGRFLSLSAGARDPRAALHAMKWISGPRLSGEFLAASPHTFPFRRSHAGLGRGPRGGSALSAEAWKEFHELFEEANRPTAWVFSPRLPGRGEYLAALDTAVRRALQGEMEPAEALAEAAEAWRTITALRGLEAQRAAYSRSLGLEP